MENIKPKIIVTFHETDLIIPIFGTLDNKNTDLTILIQCKIVEGNLIANCVLPTSNPRHNTNKKLTNVDENAPIGPAFLSQPLNADVRAVFSRAQNRQAINDGHFIASEFLMNNHETETQTIVPQFNIGLTSRRASVPLIFPPTISVATEVQNLSDEFCSKIAPAKSDISIPKILKSDHEIQTDSLATVFQLMDFLSHVFPRSILLSYNVDQIEYLLGIRKIPRWSFETIILANKIKTAMGISSYILFRNETNFPVPSLSQINHRLKFFKAHTGIQLESVAMLSERLNSKENSKSDRVLSVDEMSISESLKYSQHTLGLVGAPT